MKTYATLCNKDAPAAGESVKNAVHMSTSEEINAVFCEDIARKSQIVCSKYGPAPFYENFHGFCIEGLYDGLGIEQIVCSEFMPRSKNAHKNRKKR
jgi:hypothetical protein